MAMYKQHKTRAALKLEGEVFPLLKSGRSESKLGRNFKRVSVRLQEFFGVNAQECQSDCKSPLSDFKSPLSDFKSPLSDFKSPLTSRSDLRVLWCECPGSFGVNAQECQSDFKSPLSDLESFDVNAQSPLSDFKKCQSDFKSPMSDFKSPMSDFKSPIV
ncbi:hypothetical protein DPMN_042372 [Dreissena polymorpha]|uniref:Uncharacterized protein n=1 Tax=Dreissena polymorpha TaxID=45954 RepID=A0A9D4D0Y8_DREPO|nr:hypothetical protein DPMN_042372 [Dreissena polymorpha]